MEVKHRLLNFKDMYIYQDDDYFEFSLDSVLLANFVTINLKDKRILDLCTGNAPIPMLLTNRTNALIDGIEIQKEIFELGIKSIKVNKLEHKIKLINDDLNNLLNNKESEIYDVITCNPPYFKINEKSYINNNEIKKNARHEALVKLEDVFKVTKKLLKNGGTFAMVHRPERLIEIISLMKKYNIEPKKIELAYPKNGKNANILLIEGTKNGNSGLKIMPPLIIHNNDNEYTLEIKDMFGK